MNSGSRSLPFAVLVTGLTLVAPPAAAQVCDGDVTLTTQAEVDAFACAEVTGTIEVGPSTDITNLDGLSELTAVSGDFIIGHEKLVNTALADIGGLSSLVTVGGELRIAEAGALTTLDGLSALTSVGDLVIELNPVLESVAALSSLTTVEGELQFDENDVLANVDGLSALTSVGTLFIEFSAFENLDGLSGLTSIGEDLILDNVDALTGVDGLAALLSVGGDVEIVFNDALANLDGLAALESVGGSFSISENSVLADLDGLAGLATVDAGFSVRENAQLVDLDGLAGLTAVGGNFRVRENEQLANLDGLAALTEISGDLDVTENGQLGDCCGIFGLLDGGGVGGTVTIDANAPGCNSVPEVVAACSAVATEAGTERPGYALAVFPNPAAGAATLRFGLPAPAAVRLAVYDVRGRLVGVVVEGEREAGPHVVEWDGAGLSGGVYVVRLEVEGASVVDRRVALTR
ncbi:MAG: T9SS type A sorting domain-containing protein [Rhodothermales bacterium]|nr:T9SS type A sorting domain-containing protein [Rhodothermales bacterium]